MAIEETEYTPYYDVLQILKRDYKIIPSNQANRFRPTLTDYQAAVTDGEKYFLIKSNPCNPTGVTWSGDTLKSFVEFCSKDCAGGLFDEAYEFFYEPSPESALRYVRDLESCNIFVVGAATKGLQAPGARVGWVISSKKNIELFRNFSSISMGGVSRPSQIFVSHLLELERVTLSRTAVSQFYGSQRRRYEVALAALGFELFTGDGGFYHWARLPNGLTADEFNERLFRHKAAILPGCLCDMYRREGEQSSHRFFIRFSFGPLSTDSFEGDIEILRNSLQAI